MADIIKLVQGDTRPALVVTLTDGEDGPPISLGGATVRLKFRASGSETIHATIVGSVIDGPNGVCAFHWSSEPGALDVEPGNYEGEIEITFADGEIQTMYEILKFKVRGDF